MRRRRTREEINSLRDVSVEVDAIPPPALLALVRDSIERHVDPRRVAVLDAAEESERQLLGGRPGMLGAMPIPTS